MELNKLGASQTISSSSDRPGLLVWAFSYDDSFDSNERGFNCETIDSVSFDGVFGMVYSDLAEKLD